MYLNTVLADFFGESWDVISVIHIMPYKTYMTSL